LFQGKIRVFKDNDRMKTKSTLHVARIVKTVQSSGRANDTMMKVADHHRAAVANVYPFGGLSSAAGGRFDVSS
jgi:hypothetical protein